MPVAALRSGMPPRQMPFPFLSKRRGQQRTRGLRPRRAGRPLPTALWFAGAPPPWPRRSSRSAAAPVAFACRSRRPCRCAGIRAKGREPGSRVASRRRAAAAPRERQHEVHGALRRRLGPRGLGRRLLQQLSQKSGEKGDESALQRRRAIRAADVTATRRRALAARSSTRAHQHVLQVREGHDERSDAFADERNCVWKQHHVEAAPRRQARHVGQRAGGGRQVNCRRGRAAAARKGGA